MTSLSPHLAAVSASPLAEGDLIASLGPVADTHVAVIGDRTLDAMCALIRAGCTAVSEIALTGRAPIDAVEVVVVPHANSVQGASRAVAVALRALLPCGRILLKDPDGHLAPDIAAMLRANGFCAVRIKPAGAGRFVIGERPLFGRAAAAVLA